MFLLKDRASILPSLKTYSIKKLNVNGHPAYQGIAIDDRTLPNGVLIATAIYIKNSVAIVSLLKGYNPQIGVEEQIPWQNYNLFVESLK